ncbi:HCNGP-domain-containing protein [Dacryopinax primogenitus]|uniref:HCNGP-domain-containing protein n=1 Tax=Dacryopinax primogenitus (strain DJM 731) TaxID=1858805 RepID=M5FWE7_DACPD|nr:HCNGP-domain-containing protein [Dacryopinax primogenitus]EJU02246.1 HCNGP-domain-containing protein [Dacryopinax primogenitus]
MSFLDRNKKHMAIPTLVCCAQVTAGMHDQSETEQRPASEPGPSKSNMDSPSSRLSPPPVSASPLREESGASRTRVVLEPHDEEACLRVLLRPARIDSVDDWAIPPRPEGEPDPALVAKLARFHALKRTGKHFNDTLMSNKAFRNPHIYEKLVNFVDVDEKGSNFPKDVWDPLDFRPEWRAEALAEEQKRRSEAIEASQARGKRSEIKFASSKSGEKPRHREHRERDRDREREPRERHEPYPSYSRDRERDEKWSRWDMGGPSRERDNRENGGR